jgi:hypothetical protein
MICQYRKHHNVKENLERQNKKIIIWPPNILVGKRRHSPPDGRRIPAHYTPIPDTCLQNAAEHRVLRKYKKNGGF